MLSLMFASHSGSGRSLFRFAGYAHGPFFIMPHYVDGTEIKTRLRSETPQDKPGVDLISDALSFGRLWYGEPNAVSCVYLLT